MNLVPTDAVQVRSQEAVKSEKNTTSRSASIDVLKVVAIFSVVFIHASYLIPFSFSSLDLTKQELSLATRALRFCVPVFIVLWAYFMEKTIVKNGSKATSSRFFKLFIPFAVWSLVYFLLLADLHNLRLAKVITMHWLGMGWSGQYYFIVLFQLLILFPYIRKATQWLMKYPVVFIIASLLFYGLVSHLGLFNYDIIKKIGDRPFVYWLPYVGLGIIYAHRSILKFRIPVIIAVLSICLIPAEVYFTHPNDLSAYMLPSVGIATFLLVDSMLHVKLSYENLKPWIGNWIQTIARNTLGIFCLNPLVILFLADIFKRFNIHLQFAGASVILPLASTIMVMSIAELLIYILKRIKLGALVAN